MTFISDNFCRNARFPVRGRSIAVAGFTALALAATLTAAPQASAAVGGPAVYVANSAGGKVAADSNRLLSKARRFGSVPVIVGLRVGFRPEGGLSAFQAANQRTAIAAATDSVLDGVRGAENVKRFGFIPSVAMAVDAAGLRALLDHPDVVSVSEDTKKTISLKESTRIIKANKLWKQTGKTGKGWAIAVLDTGVNLRHRAYRRKIVSQACYSTNHAPDNATSVCPGGKASSTRKKSGKNCPLSIDGCDHGTHVAGIALGDPKNAYKGVGKKASLIAVQVFTKLTGAANCDGDAACITAYDSDIISGLERVYRLRRKFKIASVNMSLGGGLFSDVCDASEPDTKMAIDNLVSKKIAVVVASGNDSATGQISSPACISSAVAVGSTTKSDEISDFSNHSALVDLLAPGSAIKSAVPGNKFDFKSGTSMATPHVAGAWALMKQARGKAKVHEVLRALACTGEEIEAGGITKPRIDVLKAYKVLRRPDAKETWTFNKKAQVEKWQDELGRWIFRNKNMYVHGGGATIWLAATSPFCASSIKVVARVKRIDPDSEKDWNSGLFLFSRIDDDKNMSGMWFAYNKFDEDGDGSLGRAEIWRLAGINGETNSGGSAELLCEADDVKVNEQKYNTLRVVSQGGVHQFFLNNIKVCEANDTTFKTGDVAMVMAGPGGDKSHKYFVNSVAAEQLAADVKVASGAATAPLDVPAGSSPLGVGVKPSAVAASD